MLLKSAFEVPSYKMEVGTPNADFDRVWVSQVLSGSRHLGCRLQYSESRHPQCRLQSRFCMVLLEVSKWNADFNTVKVGIPDADFNSNVHSCFILRNFIIK